MLPEGRISPDDLGLWSAETAVVNGAVFGRQPRETIGQSHAAPRTPLESPCAARLMAVSTPSEKPGGSRIGVARSTWCARAPAVAWISLIDRVKFQVRFVRGSIPELYHHVFTVGAVVTKLIGISGSLRRGSFNTALLRAAAEFVPDGAELTVETIHGIPLYDADVETADGIPERVAALKEAIVAADGMLLATPEYNNSMPGTFKNAIDWLSRPPADIGRVFGGKPVAVLGASPGGFGTVLSQNAWLPVLRTLGTGRRLGTADAFSCPVPGASSTEPAGSQAIRQRTSFGSSSKAS